MYIYQSAIKCEYQITGNWPNDHKIYQYLPLQDPPKFTQTGIFGLKICIPSGNPARSKKTCLCAKRSWCRSRNYIQTEWIRTTWIRTIEVGPNEFGQSCTTRIGQGIVEQNEKLRRLILASAESGSGTILSWLLSVIFDPIFGKQYWLLNMCDYFSTNIICYNFGQNIPQI
jgi:hypothetical protein